LFFSRYVVMELLWEYVPEKYWLPLELFGSPARAF
jgi:hypothetical protein